MHFKLKYVTVDTRKTVKWMILNKSGQFYFDSVDETRAYRFASEEKAKSAIDRSMIYTRGKPEIIRCIN